ncbi:MAG: hypothetical protein HC869_20675 [Rhodospirillales bacterium]|nr:hypothetical protein [Rhodospirillales bacterium]
MSNAIDWTHLSENYRGKWVALAEDDRTVVAAGETAKDAHEMAAKKPGRHFLYQVPGTLDLFVGYAI